MVLRRLAARRPHVLTIAPAPLSDEVLRLRLAVEAELSRRRWPVADSPADADVVLLAGTPGPRLAAVVEAVWATVPAPRVRVAVESVAGIGPALDDAQERLRGGRRTWSDSDDERQHGRSADTAMAGLADDDRDGLLLDAVHVALGPVLPHWPSGLVVHATLAGDLVTDAHAEVLDAPATVGAGSRGRSPLGPDRTRLDVLTRLLALAGADHLAEGARDLRDRDPAPGELTAFGRRIARHRPLRWATRGIPLVGDPVGERTVTDRVVALGRALGTSLAPPPRPTADKAARTLIGLELGAARLALAAMDPDTGLGAGPVAAFAPQGVGHHHH
ncbi:hypothetical protein [Actinomycetospora atypica]|uniref:Uncharacterized protein n=1 Tax=Actinomycetospora atypica TaxID=1290095 RepID=A0ABV9YLL6_9PSEU